MLYLFFIFLNFKSEVTVFFDKNIEEEILNIIEEEEEGVYINSFVLTSNKIREALQTQMDKINAKNTKKKGSDLFESEKFFVDILISNFSKVYDIQKLIYRHVPNRFGPGYYNTRKPTGFQLRILSTAEDTGYLHNKIMIFKKSKIIVTGSFNFTNWSSNNHENIVVIEDEDETFNAYIEYYEKLWKKGKQFQEKTYFERVFKIY